MKTSTHSPSSVCTKPSLAASPCLALPLWQKWPWPNLCQRPNLLHLATNMHVGVGHAFFMIGILLLASRKADIAVAKTILIAYLIGIAAMFAVMNMVSAKAS